MKSLIILFWVFILHSLSVRGEEVLFEYEGKKWLYSDFAEFQDENFFETFRSKRLEDFPADMVMDYLIVTEPTGPAGRAVNAKNGADLIDSYKQNFVANFLVSESISEFIRERNLDERFPGVVEVFENAVSSRAITIVQYFKAFDASVRDDGDYKAFVERFQKAFVLSDRYPSREAWEWYQSEGGEVYRIRNKLLPYTNLSDGPSRWLIDVGKKGLLLALIQELIREDYEELVKLLEEESSIYKVLLVRIADTDETDINFSKGLLKDLTSKFEIGEIKPSLFQGVSGVSTAAWEKISGGELKQIAAPYDFFQGISNLGLQWIKVPEQNAFIYLIDSKPVSSGKNFIENDALYADARALMWKRILETHIFEIYDSMEVEIDVPDLNISRLISSLGSGGISENVFGVPTGWRYEFIGYDVLLEEFAR